LQIRSSGKTLETDIDIFNEIKFNKLKKDYHENT